VILIVQVHPHHHTIHFYFRCTGRRGPAIPITSTPTYAWDNFTLLCNQTHDPLKCRSETKFHTVCGYSMHIWFTEKKCRPGVCNRFWNETPVQSLSTSGTQTQQSAQMWEQSVRNNSWGVCVWVGGGGKSATRGMWHSEKTSSLYYYKRYVRCGSIHKRFSSQSHRPHTHPIRVWLTQSP